MRARVSVLASLACVVVVLACGSDDDWSYDGPRSACSTGAPAASNEVFPNVEETSNGLPECVPRCGVGKETFGTYGNVWTIEALPRGACSNDGEVCSMGAVRTRVCENGEKTACSLTPYQCRCESGSWRCYQGPVGGSACTCTIPDGGTD